MVMGTLTQETDLVIIGAGPGGYVAALRAADLGLEVLLVEQRERMGGTCLLEGCIPSKTIINAVGLAVAAREAGRMGLRFDGMRFDLDALRGWTEEVVGGLARGVSGLLERRGVEVMQGQARFTGANTLSVQGSGGAEVRFRRCLIATGSRPVAIPQAAALPVWTSTEALSLSEIPQRLLVVGGGVIGLELGLAYAGLGSSVSVVDASKRLMPAADPDLGKVLERRCGRRFEKILLQTTVDRMASTTGGLSVSFTGAVDVDSEEYDRVLVSVGRRPNTDELGLDRLGLPLNDRGFIGVDEHGRTALSHIFAIGDVTPGPMLAHRASRQARVAAEVMAGQASAFDNRAIPAVVYTDPEMAWTGLTEQDAAASGRVVRVGRFPLKALGRAHTMGRTDGLVKVISDPDTDAVLGVGMVGTHVSELIGEATLALELGATLEDLMVTIHPHPTLSEALVEAAEVAAGAAVHVHQKAAQASAA